MKTKNLLYVLVLSATQFLSSQSYAATTPTVAQPTSCVVGAFTKSGSSGWFSINLKITNNCSAAVNFQNSTINFKTATALNTNFWGSFNPLAYPSNDLQITSQPQAGGGFLASLLLQFPQESWANTILQKGQSFTITYGNSKADYNATSVLVYINGTPPPSQTGEIDITNSAAQPSGVTQSYAVIDIASSGTIINKAQVPWGGVLPITGLNAGTYTIQPESVTGGSVTYQGTAKPASLNVVANQKVSSIVTYSQPTATGSVTVKVAALPSALQGYTQNPVVTLTRKDTGSSTSQTIPWNSSANFSQLAANISYTPSTPNINYNSSNCAGAFSPTTVTSSATPPTTTLSYTCVTVAQDKVNLSVSGLTSSTPSVNITFTPNNNATPITSTVNLTNGAGTGSVMLTDGAIYSVASTVSGYTATFNPASLTATPTASETITFKAQATGGSGGRIIGYLPGWQTPPTASALKAAGYTHILVAFGVFSTTTPGTLVSAFDTVTAAYIQSLHAAGIKVLLSIGGASTSSPNTSVNFHQVLSSASSPAVFQQNMVKSIESFMTQYGFDGFDIDIEQGLVGSGNFASPTGDIAVLAAVINQVHSDNPNALITLVPQTANISATQSFNDTWGNYASLIMQTHAALTWVGIQLYNTGCTMGIDDVCYDPNSTPNYGVSQAVDLLENWPAKLANGQATGFLPYISYLTPDQVVLGYPSVDNTGSSDGAPAGVPAKIKRAIQCLRTAVASATSCDTYVPPRAYPGIGGVFDWEVIHDQSSGFKFATGLTACVINGSC